MVEEARQIDLVCERCDPNNDDAEWFTLDELAAAPQTWARGLERRPGRPPGALMRWLADLAPRPPRRPVADPAEAAETTSWLTVEAVAERVEVSERTIYRALRARALHGSKPSGPKGHWRIAPADIEAWVAAGRPTGSPRARPTAKDVTGRPGVNPDLTWNP